MSKIQRVKKIIKWLIFSDFGDNETEIAALMGYSKSSLSQILNEKVPLSEKFIENLCRLDENINKVWISDGEGEMLLSKQIENGQPNASNFNDLIGIQKELTERLKESQSHVSSLIEIIKNK